MAALLPFLAIGRVNGGVPLAACFLSNGKVAKEKNTEIFRKLLTAAQQKLKSGQRIRLEANGGNVFCLMDEGGELMACVMSSQAKFPEDTAYSLLVEFISMTFQLCEGEIQTAGENSLSEVLHPIMQEILNRRFDCMMGRRTVDRTLEEAILFLPDGGSIACLALGRCTDGALLAFVSDGRQEREARSQIEQALVSAKSKLTPGILARSAAPSGSTSLCCLLDKQGSLAVACAVCCAEFEGKLVTRLLQELIDLARILPGVAIAGENALTKQLGTRMHRLMQKYEDPSKFEGLLYLGVCRVRDGIVLVASSDAEADLRDRAENEFTRMLESSRRDLTPGHMSRVRFHTGSLCTLMDADGMLFSCTLTTSAAYPDRSAYQMLNEAMDVVRQNKTFGRVAKHGLNEPLGANIAEILFRYEGMSVLDLTAEADPTIGDGTNCLATVAASIWDTASASQAVGELLPGELVVAAGPPYSGTVHPYPVVPVRPRGVVEAAVLCRAPGEPAVPKQAAPKERASLRRDSRANRPALLTSRSSCEQTIPEPISGVLVKKGSGMAGRVSAVMKDQKRFVSLKEGRMEWAQSKGGEVKGCANFMDSVGKWQVEAQGTIGFVLSCAGATAALSSKDIFELKESDFSRDQWVQAIKEHIGNSAANRSESEIGGSSSPALVATPPFVLASLKGAGTSKSFTMRCGTMGQRAGCLELLLEESDILFNIERLKSLLQVDYMITVTKEAGQAIGVTKTQGGKGLIINDEAGTLIDKWNAENPDVQASPGDYVMEINGAAEPADMVQELRTQTVLRMRLVAKADMDEPQVTKQQSTSSVKSSGKAAKASKEAAQLELKCASAQQDLDAAQQRIAELEKGAQAPRRGSRRSTAARQSRVGALTSDPVGGPRRNSASSQPPSGARYSDVLSPAAVRRGEVSSDSEDDRDARIAELKAGLVGRSPGAASAGIFNTLLGAGKAARSDLGQTWPSRQHDPHSDQVALHANEKSKLEANKAKDAAALLQQMSGRIQEPSAEVAPGSRKQQATGSEDALADTQVRSLTEALDAAMQQGSVDNLRQALDAAQGQPVEEGILLRARQALEEAERVAAMAEASRQAEAELSSALADGSLEALRAAVEKARALGSEAPVSALAEAEQAIVAGERKETWRAALQGLRNSGSEDALKAAIQEGKMAGLASSELAEFEEMVVRIQKKAAAEAALQAAVGERSHQKLESAISQGKEVGADAALLALAETLFREESAKHTARQSLEAMRISKDIDSLKAATAAAKVAGLPDQELDVFVAMVARLESQKAAEEELGKAIGSLNVEALKAAIEEAKRVEVDTEKVEEAEAVLTRETRMQTARIKLAEACKTCTKAALQEAIELAKEANLVDADLATAAELLAREEQKDKLIAEVNELLTKYKTVDMTSIDALKEAKRELSQIIASALEIGVPEAALQEAEIRRKKLHNTIEDLKGSIRVFCRIRPLSSKEKEQGDDNITKQTDLMTLEVRDERQTNQFHFDAVFTPGTQDAIFEDCKDLIQSAIDGYNVTLFAYGQTGAGKTFTMAGIPGQEGVSPRTVNELFRLTAANSSRFDYVLAASMVELYRQDLIDLLQKTETSKKVRQKALNVRMDKSGTVICENLTEEVCHSEQELFALMERGNEMRSVAATEMNSESSRSHLIQIIRIVSTNKETGDKMQGKLLIVDLAGSERLKKSQTTADAQKESIEINKSLTALGDVIEALTKHQKQIPYRNHLLTRMMQDSLGGSAKTLMFVNCSPAVSNYEETVTSLKYATRAKKIENSQVKH